MSTYPIRVSRTARLALSKPAAFLTPCHPAALPAHRRRSGTANAPLHIPERNVTTRRRSTALPQTPRFVVVHLVPVPSDSRPAQPLAALPTRRDKQAVFTDVSDGSTGAALSYNFIPPSRPALDLPPGPVTYFAEIDSQRGRVVSLFSFTFSFFQRRAPRIQIGGEFTLIESPMKLRTRRLTNHLEWFVSRCRWLMSFVLIIVD